MKSDQPEVGYRQRLFNHLEQEHHITALESEMGEIEEIVFGHPDLVALRDENAQLKAQLADWQRLATDPMCTHQNILRGTIAYNRESALHYACAQDYDDLKAQLNQARNDAERCAKACAEMRHVLEQFDWEDAIPDGHFPAMADWERALSTDCGQHYIHVDELEPTIELLNYLREATHSLVLKTNIDRELARLKSLKKKCK